jgi:uncharacterized protein (TIGR00297 family)
MPLADVLIYLFLVAGVLISYFTRKLTLPGALTGGLVGLLIYKGAGIAGLGMMSLFFIAGSWATGWQRESKATAEPSTEHKSGRTAWQVIANAGVAAILGAMVWAWPVNAPVFQIMIAGSLASATADTLSSELGMVYGRRFYNVLSFKPDLRGLDGVVSLEGTLIGAIGAMLIAFIYSLTFGWGIAFILITAAGIIGNMVDSVLGAAFERKALIGNNLVNFLNTLIGALTCLLTLILNR